MKDEKKILEYLAGIPKYEGNKNLINGATGRDIQVNTQLSPSAINKAVKHMLKREWVKLIPSNEFNNEYYFVNVWITDLGNKQYFISRINDWKKRISDLYSLVKKWLIEKPGYEIKLYNKVNMYEELMEKYEIEKQLLDVADIFKKDKLILSIKPVGLWILGGNGRVDLITRSESFIMVDLAGKYEDPKWTVFKSGDRRNGQVFSKEIFFEIISD